MSGQMACRSQTKNSYKKAVGAEIFTANRRSNQAGQPRGDGQERRTTVRETKKTDKKKKNTRTTCGIMEEKDYTMRS